MVLPLAAVCVASFGLGVFVEMMMVQWTVTMARNIPSDKLARVSSYDVLGSVMAMPAGALIAGPLGTAIGISYAQYAAAAAIIVASALALIPRDVRTMRGGDPAVPPAAAEAAGELLDVVSRVAAGRRKGRYGGSPRGPRRTGRRLVGSDVLLVRAERHHRQGHAGHREDQQAAAADADRAPVRAGRRPRSGRSGPPS